MKTISLELSKRLAPHLGNIKTEYWYAKSWGVHIYKEDRQDLIKTLTFEESINFILSNLSVEDVLELWNNYCCFFLKWELILELSNFSLLKSMERIINYLLDNNLLGKNILS